MTYPNEPTLDPIAERLRERTQPLAPDDAAYGYAHAYLSGALGAIFGEVAEVFDPEGDLPPMAPLLDPELCPDWALPWLAQLVGTKVPAGMAPDDARTLISSVAGFRRGTPAALRAAASVYLTGSKTVYFRERYGAGADPPYTLSVATLTNETPNPSAVLAALQSQKPGGIVLQYQTITGWNYDGLKAAGGTYAALTTTFATYNDLRDNTPH